MLQEEGSHGDAIDALRLALFDAPGSAVVWMRLATSYDAGGRGTRAEECAGQALRRDGRLVDAHRFLARRMLDRDDPEAARPHAEKLAALAPDDAEAAHLLGRTYVALSMWRPMECHAVARELEAWCSEPSGPIGTPENALRMRAALERALRLLRAHTEAVTRAYGESPALLGTALNVPSYVSDTFALSLIHI